MNAAVSLDAYRRRRDFKLTREPEGRGGRADRTKARFVVQKHAASRLHYDFRLEIGGTLKSWAVPKGIPFAAGEKHLAVHVEDHPLEYAGFEGTIPAGEYGAGTVMIWDRGTFEPAGASPAQDLEHGKFEFRLHGEKLKGEWTLVRMRGESDQWLLIKTAGPAKPPSAKRDDCSVVSGRTMKQIAAETREGPVVRARRKVQPSNPGDDAGVPEFVEPMLARLVAVPPPRGKWTFEVKLDGFRALAIKDGRRVSLLSRNRKDLANRFPEIVQSLAALPANRVILDGEIVALDKCGRPSFQLLQDGDNVSAPVVFYIFDLLREGRQDLRGLPLVERRARLESLLEGVGDPLRFSSTLTGSPSALLQKACSFGFEGLIAKRADSTYESGRRSGAWLKIKCTNQQEFVIGGFTAPRGTRKFLGAILIGYYQKRQLRFAGKVGTGFSVALCRDLHQKLARIEQASAPFSDFETATHRGAAALSPSEMRGCRWVKPRLVCEVKFAGWTRDGRLRQPVFMGLRDDKPPASVIRERPEA